MIIFKKRTLIAMSLILLMACSHIKTQEFILSNDFISRTIVLKKGKLYTSQLQNKRIGAIVQTDDLSDFQIRISQGTDKQGTDVVLNSDAFDYVKTLIQTNTELAFLLRNVKHGIFVTVHYTLESSDTYTRKYLEITADNDVVLERIDVEKMAIKDITQPYTIKQITAQGVSKWRPGLGQPLYIQKSALFFGVEFPAADNIVDTSKGNTAYCGYLHGKVLKKNTTYASYKSVIGAGSKPAMIQDAFFEYIDNIRIRPLRLQVQYNSWFDFTTSVSEEKFAKSVSTIHRELVKKRGVTPLKSYVIDSGWQDTDADWSKKTWKINQKFSKDFKQTFSHVQNCQSNLGLWISPGLVFNCEQAVKNYRKQGFRVLNNWMSMADEKYMSLFEKRILEFTQLGITYFKLDGIFGHLNTREFEINGKGHNVPTMPQLGVSTLKANDEKLNDYKYDELKTYYLVAGTERLMKIFKKQHALNPNVYVVISNGAYLSPWWLMYIDAVWMINAQDAAQGSNRTQELVYRDGIYYDTWVTEKTQFPMHSIFNHEPKKVKTGESKAAFSEYLWMNLSRGTGFIEFYIKTQKLSSADWDVLAAGLKWAEKSFPYFKKVRMHGGNPNKNEIYGYTGWNEKGGYISVHNPSDKLQKYSIVLNEKLGISKKQPYRVTSPLSNAKQMKNKKIYPGDTLEISLKPKQVKIFDFKTPNFKTNL